MRAHVDGRQTHLGYSDFLVPDNIQPIDRSVGVGNGKFIGHVANGMSRADLVQRWKAGEFPHLNKTIALNALSYAGRGSMEGETA